MPIYSFECSRCGRGQDIYMTFDEIESKSPRCCGAKMKHVIGENIHFTFKGSGFHATDYDKQGPRGRRKPIVNSGGGSI